MKIGRSIRYLRQRRDLTQTQLAEAAGLSVSFISMLEADKSRASLETLNSILQALEISPSRFFASVEEESRVHYEAADRLVVYERDGCQQRLLKPSRTGELLEAFLVRIEPGSRFTEIFQRDRGEECGFIIRGRFQLKVDEDEYDLSPGDFFYFESSRRHTGGNPGKDEALILWVHAPPYFFDLKG